MIMMAEMRTSMLAYMSTRRDSLKASSSAMRGLPHLSSTRLINAGYTFAQNLHRSHQRTRHPHRPEASAPGRRGGA